MYQKKKEKKRSFLFIIIAEMNQYWDYFKSSVNQTSEGQGGAHVGILEHVSTALHKQEWRKCLDTV